MQLSYDTIRKVIEPILEYGGGDYCDEYGEPGYSFPHGAETPMFVSGNWWCRCGKNPHAGGRKTWGDGEIQPTDLHSHSDHRPRLWAQMESQGVQFEWNDEWWVDFETSKAYRTQADSYSWQPSIQWNEDIDDYMTPDHDADVWIEWALNDTSRCLMARFRSGFTQWEPNDPHRYHNGWHEGMTDDPVKVRAEIDRWSDSQEDVVFLLDETSQFYVGFSAWTRPTTEDDDA